MRLARLIASALGALSLSSCLLLGSGELSGDFWAANFEKGGYPYRVDADLLATGERSEVWVEVGCGVSKIEASQIAYEFDTGVYDAITGTFGSESDVDADGRVTILVLDIKDGFAGSGEYTAGYFNHVDLLAAEFSNERDMIYMDCNPVVPGGSLFNATMAHEFQHLINYNQNVFVQGGGEQDLWINEGLSNAAEYVYRGAHVSEKIAYYNDSGHNQLLAQGVSFLRWHGYYENYVAAYLFFHWLRIHTDGDVYRRIIDNPYTDYRAVTAQTTSIPELADWQSVVKSWYIANLLDQPTGIYGYKSEIDITSPPLLEIPSPTQLELEAGEGVLIDMGTASVNLVAEGKIAYAAVSSGGTIDDQGPEYSGDYLVAYNFDHQDKETSKASTATLPVSASVGAPLMTEPGARAARVAAPDRPPLPVDALGGLVRAGEGLPQ